MMKKYFLFAIAAMTLTMAGCKNDNDPNQKNNNVVSSELRYYEFDGQSSYARVDSITKTVNGKEEKLDLSQVKETAMDSTGVDQTVASSVHNSGLVCASAKAYSIPVSVEGDQKETFSIYYTGTLAEPDSTKKVNLIVGLYVRVVREKGVTAKSSVMAFRGMKLTSEFNELISNDWSVTLGE